MKKIKKKRVKETMAIEISRKTVILLHFFKFLSIAMIIGGLFLPARLSGLALGLIIGGVLVTCISSFCRDYYYRCPNCGENLFKKQPIKNRIMGKPVENCPRCHWHTNVIIK